jgi:hypothetical protein
MIVVSKEKRYLEGLAALPDHFLQEIDSLRLVDVLGGEQA